MDARPTGAGTVNANQIRKQIAQLQAKPKTGNRAKDDMVARKISSLLHQLDQHKAGCIHCAFGVWPKTDRCSHE
jgi:hypothetical protein